MTLLPDELRLGVLIGINALVFLAAYRFVRRFTRQDGIGAALDALLMDYLVQYGVVGVLGLMGMLGATSMVVGAMGVAGMLIWVSRITPSPLAGEGRGEGEELPFSGSDTNRKSARRRPVSGSEIGRQSAFTPHPNPLPQGERGQMHLLYRLFAIGSVLFVLGYFAGLIYQQTNAPVLGDDSLTYHLPAAAEWLRSGHIGLYNTWFFNPANTYSPLAGSMFIAWLMGPIGCDAADHYAQMPALILAMLAMVEIARSLGVRVPVAMLVATAALLSRPFISESILVKDDVFLAAFFLAAIAGCAPGRLKDRLGPWRIGVAVGLFFATKYTALLTAPSLLLVVDAPIRAGWKMKQWGIAAAVAVVLAGPWYLRNVVLTGNPLYPVPVIVGGHTILRGLFVPIRSTEMRTIRGAWNTITGMYFSVSPVLMIVLVVGWVGAIVIWGREFFRSALVRVCLLGPVVGMGIFLGVSHVNEIRYAYPSLFLLFACCALAAGIRLPLKWQARWPGMCNSQSEIVMQVGVAALIAAVSIWGGFNWKEMLLGGFVMPGIVTAAVGLIVNVFVVPLMRRDVRIRIAVWAIGLTIVTAVIYVYWPGYMIGGRREFVAGYGGENHSGPYADQTTLWEVVDQKVPAEGKLAYTNLIFTRPLMGFDYSRQVFYVPTRKGVVNYHDLPSGEEHVTDQEIRGLMAKELTADSDEQGWLERLLASGAEYLLVGKQPVLPNPPERDFAQSDPRHFSLVYEDSTGALFQVLR